MSDLSAGVRPFKRLIRWARKHHEQAGGIGAVQINQNLWIDTVVLGLRHLFGAANNNRFAICFEFGAGRATTLVSSDVNIRRVEPELLTVFCFTIESRGNHHALR